MPEDRIGPTRSGNRADGPEQAKRRAGNAAPHAVRHTTRRQSALENGGTVRKAKLQ
jgi:hypothetical protein